MRTNTQTYLDDLPVFWRFYLFYSSVAPVIYLAHPLVAQNTNHMLWVIAIIIFFGFFSRIFIGTFVTDCIELAAHIVCAFMILPQNFYGKIEIFTIVCFVLHLVFFFRYSIPDAMAGRFRPR